MKTNTRSIRSQRLLAEFGLVISGFIFPVGVTLAITSEQQKLLEKVEQLERLEHEEFIGHVNRATSCTISRNFSCAESALNSAKKVVGNTRDKNALQLAWSGLEAEKRAQAQEIAEEKRQREEFERQQQRERERAEEEQREWERERRRAEREAEDEEDARESARSWNEWAAKTQRETNAFVAQYQENERNIAALKQQQRAEQQLRRQREAEDRQRQQQLAMAQFEANRRSQAEASANQRAAQLRQQQDAEQRRQQAEQQRQEQLRQQRAEEERRRQEQARQEQAQNERRRQEAQKAEEERLKRDREAPCLSAGGRVTSGQQCEVKKTIMSPRNRSTPQKTWHTIGTLAGVQFSWIWVQSSKIMGNWAWKAENTNGHSVHVAARGLAVCSDGSRMEERGGGGWDVAAGDTYGERDQWDGTATTLCDGKGIDPVQGGVDATVKWSLKSRN